MFAIRSPRSRPSAFRHTYYQYLVLVRVRPHAQDAAVWAHVRNVCKESCVRWPGPICGSCWAASCECGYVFDDVADAAGRWFTGRMRCHECTASGPGWQTAW